MSATPIDAAGVAELVGTALDEMLTSLDGVLSVEWCDLGEVELTIETDQGADRWRLTVDRVTEDD